VSDFSAGVFILSKHKYRVYPFLKDDEFFIQYNEHWVGKLSPTDTNEDFQVQTLALSKEAPLLHIINAEDHGFCVQILHEEKIIFKFEIPYNIEADYAHEIGTELFGEDWFLDFDKAQERYQQANEEAAKRLAEKNIPAKYFDDINDEKLQAFHVFGFDEKTLKKVQQILTVENFTQDSYEMVHAFLYSIYLTKFSFVSHSYISHGDDRFTLLNK